MTEIETDHKQASTDFDVHDLIKQRWSPRAFSDEPVSAEVLRQLFDAARWAPSAFNEQPWRFIVATKDDSEAHDRLVQVMVEKNQLWAKNAPVLILTTAKDEFSTDEHPINQHAQHDLGQAVSYFTLEATRHNLYVHQMAGIHPKKARELYRIPADYTPMTMIAVGHLGDPDQLPADFQKAEKAARSRKSIDEIAFKGMWDEHQNI